MSRETLLPAIAAYVLENGLSSATLRPLAKAAGTSDRMLIYHFGNKDGLLAAILDHLTHLFMAELSAALPKEPAPDRATTVTRILAITSQPELAPFLRLWWEIVAEAARGNAAFRKMASQTMGGLLEWLELHMPEGDPDRASGARFLLTLIEGSQMLDAIGRRDIAMDGLSAVHPNDV